MAQVSLNRPGIDALVGWFVAAGVLQHVRMAFELSSCLPTGTFDQRLNSSVGKGRPAL